MGKSESISQLIPSGDELVRRAEAMIPMLRAKAEETEKARRVSDETIQAFRDAGFFKVLQPKRWGGYEMHPSVNYRILMELGRGCPSSAWNFMVLGTHQFELGLMDQAAGDWLWGDDNTRLTASSYAPMGKVKKVDGGYVLNGRWVTSSGCDNAAGGAFVGGKVFDDAGNLLDFRSFLVPPSDYEIMDDWHVAGLCGTGSKSLVLKDAFVPEFRSHTMLGYENKGKVGLYGLPFLYVFFASVSSCIVGMARGMMDLYIEHMAPRENVFMAAGSAAVNPFVKGRLGEASAKIRGSQARLLNNVNEAWTFAEKGLPVPIADRVRHFSENQCTGGECVDAAHMLFKKSATRGIWLSSPLQRQMRDIMIAANHVTQNQDDLGDLAGGFLLGQGLPPGSVVSE